MIVFGLGVLHGTWRKVHSANGIAHIWQPDAVFGAASSALFQAAHTFVRDKVWQALL